MRKLQLYELITPADAAIERGVSNQAIRGLMKRDRLTVIMRDGRQYLILEEVANFTPRKPGPASRRNGNGR